MNYTNMLYIAIASLVVTGFSSHAMEKTYEAGSYSQKSPREIEAAYNETSESYTSEVGPRTFTLVEPTHKPSSRRRRDSLITSDEKTTQQKAAQNINVRENYINSDDIKEFNRSRTTKKSKSSCFSCFK